ncbi:acyltransferase family protein [Luteolibacter marinus]|uniref:acyltransferase family protein n=1 Tax=Luteolibacter marinus TaxID=2776705 RepID=UPI001865B467|nr:acyltransferase family protein [Luteolibacter marinus]
MSLPHQATTTGSPGTRSESRLDWIDILKAIGIVLVVIGHCKGFPGVPNKWIFTFHIPLFFLVSGFLLSGDLNKGGFTVFARRRLLPLLRAYLVFGLIGIVFFTLFARFSFSTRIPWPEAVTERFIALLHGSGTIEGPLRIRPIVLWFFPALILGLATCFMLFRLPSPRARSLAFAGTGALAWQCRDLALPWEIESALAAVPILGCGCFLARHAGVLSWLQGIPIWGIAALLVIGSWVAMGADSTPDFRSSSVASPLHTIPAAAILLTGFIALAMRLRAWRWVRALSAATLVIFPLHTMVFMLIDGITKRLPMVPPGFIDSHAVYAIGKTAATLVMLTLIAPRISRWLRPKANFIAVPGTTLSR